MPDERLLLFLCVICLGGCATTQLNHNTLDLAGSLNELTQKQVLYNLARTLENPYAVPAQAGIAAGTTQTSNSINPTFTVPLNTSSMVTNTASTMVAAATTKTTTNTTAVTHPNSQVAIGLTDNWQQGWTLNPATDPDALRRLRALYRYATGRSANPAFKGYTIDEFECEYPLQATTDIPPSNSPLSQPVSVQCGTSNETMYPDPMFVRLPSCVLCYNGSVQLILNPDLAYGFVKDQPFDGSVSIGHYSKSDLYVCGDAAICRVDGRKALQDFVLFVFEATGQSASTNSAAKSPSVKALGAPILFGPIR